jgi:hypothetical protein
MGRVGVGITAMLRCPAASTERTAKITLSFEMGSLMEMAEPALCDMVHSGWSVGLQTIS